jgi:hypothetical protein
VDGAEGSEQEEKATVRNATPVNLMRWIRSSIWMAVGISVAILLVIDHRLSRLPKTESGFSVPTAAISQHSDAEAVMNAQYLLMRTVPAGPNPVFVCPGRDVDKWNFGGGSTVPTTFTSSGWRISNY